jgi:hypothetical protein
MVKKILLIMLVFLIIGATAYAAGDLMVNGNLGVGTSLPNAKLHIDNIGTSPALRGYSTVNGATSSVTNLQGRLTLSGADFNGAYSGFDTAVWHSSQNDSTPINGFIGLGASIMLNGKGTFTKNIDSIRLMLYSMNTMQTDPESTYNITDFYGFDMANSLSSGSGTINVTNSKLINLDNISGTRWNVTNQYGIFIEKQTSGITTNYGLVLDGDGIGADVAFGYYDDGVNSGRPNIYSTNGHLYAYDYLGNQTQISPHDPETGDWVYYSKNLKTGKVVKVNMEKLVKAVEKLTGKKFMIETIEDIE